MKVPLALLLLWIAQQPATADNATVEGKVLRYGTSEPISGVQVYITARTIGTGMIAFHIVARC